MTKDEARTILAMMASDRHEAEADALLMAIDALSVDGDTISRADAIDALHKSGLCYDNWLEVRSEIEALPSADAVSREDYHNLLTASNDIDRALREYQAKEEQQSAEAVQGWIPVEEQPPVFPCLVCDANGNHPSVPLGIVTITDEEHGEWHIDGRLWDSPKVFVDGEWGSQLGYGNRIIAWMPLPTPYKGGDDE